MKKKAIFQSIEQRNQERRERASRMSGAENLAEMEKIHCLHQWLPKMNVVNLDRYQGHILIRKKDDPAS